MEYDIGTLSDLLVQIKDKYKRRINKQKTNLDNLILQFPQKKKSYHHIDYSRLNNLRSKSRLNGFENILFEFQKIKNKEDILSKEKSIRFNVLDFFHIDETLHSRLLGFFLDKKGSHGQGDSFLKKFIEKLGYTDYEKGKWNVTIEKQRIDILIERNNPHSVIIIENKSNNASDQENQIYRYWHRAIYKKNKNNFNNNDKYKIIYLVSNDGKLPSENTITKPYNFSKDLPEKVPIEIDIWNFNNQIKEWLNDSLPLLSEENYRLKEYIEQYIEYWK